MSQKIEVLANKGAYVRGAQPTINFSGPGSLAYGFLITVNPGPVKSWDIDSMYVGFEYPADAVKKQIESVEFSYEVSDSDYYTYYLTSFSARFSIGAITKQWTEDEVSYLNQPPSTILPGGVMSSGKGRHGVTITPEYFKQIIEYGLAVIPSGTASIQQGWLGGGRAWLFVDIYGYGTAQYPSTYTPRLIVTVSDIVPTVLQPNPSAGYIDERKTIRFSWIFGSDETALVPPVQKSARFRWRVGTGTYTEINVGTNQYVDIPAATFPAQSEIQWQVQLVSDDDIASEWTQWFVLTTIDSASGATAIRPSGHQLDSTRAIDFTWRHASPTGTAQSAAELEIRYGDGDWQPLAYITGLEQTYTHPPETLQGGRVAWRVRTYNTQGVAGEWSQELENIIIASPGMPIINAIERTKARPLISWQCGEQQSYRLTISRDGKTVTDTGIIVDTERRHKVLEYLENGEYTVRIMVANEYDLWSEWGELTYTVDAYKPPLPELFIGDILYGVTLSFQNIPDEIASIQICRIYNGTDNMIAEIFSPFKEYVDYSASGSPEYYIRCINNQDDFSESKKRHAKPFIPKMVLSPVDNPSEIIEIWHRMGSEFTRPAESAYEGSLAHYAGRSLPVVEFSEFKNRSWPVVATLRGREEYDKFLRLIDGKHAILLRDPFGLNVHCAIMRYRSENELMDYYYTVEMELHEIDRSEER